MAKKRNVRLNRSDTTVTKELVNTLCVFKMQKCRRPWEFKMFWDTRYWARWTEGRSSQWKNGTMVGFISTQSKGIRLICVISVIINAICKRVSPRMRRNPPQKGVFRCYCSGGQALHFSEMTRDGSCNRCYTNKAELNQLNHRYHFNISKQHFKFKRKQLFTMMWCHHLSIVAL